jgi:hypothetical protein
LGGSFFLSFGSIPSEPEQVEKKNSFGLIISPQQEAPEEEKKKLILFFSFGRHRAKNND